MKKEYNCRIYNYPTGTHVTFFSKTISREVKEDVNGDEEIMYKEEEKEETKENEECERTQEQIEHSLRVSMNRTKNSIYNVARSNIWEWFITLTFDRKKVDSSDYNTVVKKLSKFMNNLNQRKCPNLKYLIVPELHADKTNYHFHGLLANCDGLDFKESRKKDFNGNVIYNIKNWSFGFTTATKVINTGRVSSYITKYMTKDVMEFIPHKRRFYINRNVEKIEPILEMVSQKDFFKTYGSQIKYTKTVSIPEAHMHVEYYELSE